MPRLVRNPPPIFGGMCKKISSCSLIMPVRKNTRSKRRSNASRRISHWNRMRVQPFVRGSGWMQMLKQGAAIAAKAGKAAISNPLVQQRMMNAALSIAQGQNVADTLKQNVIGLKNDALEQYAGIPSGSGRRRVVRRRPRGRGLNTGGKRKKKVYRR